MPEIREELPVFRMCPRCHHYHCTDHIAHDPTSSYGQIEYAMSWHTCFHKIGEKISANTGRPVVKGRDCACNYWREEYNRRYDNRGRER